MWSSEYTIETAASPAAVWSLWSDPACEHEYDEGIEWARLDGPLAPGTKGQLKLRGAPQGGFTVLEVEPGRRIITQAGPPLARMRFDRRVEPLAAGGSRLYEQITIRGPFAGVVGFLFGRSMAERLPKALHNLSRLAEQTPAR
jgi:uncharacterized protein YndB with AHSA1/START domain